jgi:hypothetical protein
MTIVALVYAKECCWTFCREPELTYVDKMLLREVDNRLIDKNVLAGNWAKVGILHRFDQVIWTRQSLSSAAKDLNK